MGPIQKAKICTFLYFFMNPSIMKTANGQNEIFGEDNESDSEDDVAGFGGRYVNIFLKIFLQILHNNLIKKCEIFADFLR